MQYPWKAPIAIPIASITTIASAMGSLLFTIITAPIAPTRHTTDPTERSMFPPVSIQSSIPVASMKTYAFCAIKLFTFWGSMSIPFVAIAKNKITTTVAIVIAFFVNTPFIFMIFLLLSFMPSLYQMSLRSLP